MCLINPKDYTSKLAIIGTLILLGKSKNSKSRTLDLTSRSQQNHFEPVVSENNNTAEHGLSEWIIIIL